jgi:ATP-binding cassette subfamily C protein CydC
MRELLRLAPLYRPYLGWIALSLLAAVVSALAGAGLMAAAGGLVAAGAVGAAAAAPSMLVRLFVVLRAGARYGERVVGHEATLRVVAEARGWLFAKLAPLAPGALADLHSGEALARLKTDVGHLDTAFLKVAMPLATAAVSAAAIAAFAARYDLRYAALYVGLAVLGGLALPLAFSPRLKRAATETARLHGERRRALVDALDGLSELIVSGAFAGRAAEAQAQFATQTRAEEREHGALAWTQSAASLAADCAVIGALALGALALQAGRLGPSEVAMLTLLLAAGFEPLLVLPISFAALPTAAASMRRILNLAERRPLVADPADPVAAPDGYAIELRDLRYAYAQARAPAIDGVSLDFAEGARAALVGASGAGKTTLTELILRIRDPDRGEVRIGGVPARRLRLEDLRAFFAVAPQFPHLFERSLADNLRLGNPTASEAEMRRALELVGLSRRLDEFPAGLASDIGPLGARLSVGEARRVAIARAWLSRAPVLILDEPTEGLDGESERRLIDNMTAAAGARSLIAVTHSAEAAAKFETVVTVENGSARQDVRSVARGG